MNSGKTQSIILSSIGNGPESYLPSIGSEIRRLFGYPTIIAPLMDDIDFSYNPQRDQYHSTAILTRLAELAPPDALKILAVTDRDLYIPILTHVYGEAQLGGKTCIVSTHRLGEGISAGSDVERLRCRLVKEAIHELGHTFNLKHCPETRCIMHYCRKIDHVDRKSQAFCRYCRVLLQDELGRMTESTSETPPDGTGGDFTS